MVSAKEKPIIDRDIDISVISVRTCDSEQLEDINNLVMVMEKTQKKRGIPVTLISKNGKLQKYYVSTEGNKLLLTPDHKTKTIIEHDLRNL